MTSATELSLMATQLFLWLFVILPVFDTVHHRFFQSATHRAHARFRLRDWYFAFIKALRQRSAESTPLFLAFSRRALLFVTLGLNVMALSTLPLSSSVALTNGSDHFSPFFVFALLFCSGIPALLMAYTLKRHFLSLSTLEYATIRLSTLLIVVVATATTPFIEWDLSMRHLVEAQTGATLGDFPAWGALLNPFAFFSVCVAMALYLRQWQEENYPQALGLRKSLQSELCTTELVGYQIARSIEFILLYALIVVVFLGGPFWLDTEVSALLSLGIFTLKLTLLVFVVLVIQYVLPKMNSRQVLRVLFLILLPILVAGYPLSLAISQLVRL